MHSILPSFLWLALIPALACRSLKQPPPALSETEGVISAIDDLIPIPKVKSSLELISIGRGLAQKSVTRAAFTTSKTIRPQFKLALFSQIKDAGGIPRDQTKAMLESLVDPQSTACGGVSCQRVLGFSKNEVDQVLDESFDDVKKSKFLLKPEMRPTRVMLLGSLQKARVESLKKSLNGPQKIVFEMVKSVGAKDLHISPKGMNVTLDIKPSDLLRTEKIECFKDLCEATMHIPFTLNANMPAPLKTEVRLTYVHKPDAMGKVIEQSASIQGHMVPLNIFEILRVSVDFSADFEKSTQTAQKMVIKEVKCKGSVNCNLPMMSLEAKVDREGIEFNAVSPVHAFDAGLAKVSRDSAHFTKKLKFEDLPKAIQGIKSGLDLVKSGIKREDLDILWDEFADIRGGQM
jgi:hypothetical protein